jgi:hypothetical protein
MNRTLTATLIGISPLSQSKDRGIDKDKSESHDEFERRTFRMKAHVDPESGHVHIPAMGLKKSIAEAGRRLSLKKSGQTKWTADILSSVIVTGDIDTGFHINDVREERVYCHVDGNPKSGKRVWRSFPIVPAGWKGQASIVVIDETIPENVVEQCLEAAGNIIGVCRFRPEKGGFLGRFKVDKIKWGTE